MGRRHRKRCGGASVRVLAAAGGGGGLDRRTKNALLCGCAFGGTSSTSFECSKGRGTVVGARCLGVLPLSHSSVRKLRVTEYQDTNMIQKNVVHGIPCTRSTCNSNSSRRKSRSNNDHGDNMDSDNVRARFLQNASAGVSKRYTLRPMGPFPRQHREITTKFATNLAPLPRGKPERKAREVDGRTDPTSTTKRDRKKRKNLLLYCETTERATTAEGM